MRHVTAFLFSIAFATPAVAQDDWEDAYVEANLLSIFYHELGHALIEILALPVFGQEEDAADTASALMIDMLFEEDTAQDILRLAAFGYLDENEARTEQEPAWWDTHGPDLQRYYNLVCQFYGGDPEEREALAQELSLPTERAEGCQEEFELALDSWHPVFDEIAHDAGGSTIVYEGGTSLPLQTFIAREVDALNEVFRLPNTLVVTVEACGEANAFYDLDATQIIICTELDQHLRDLAAITEQ